MLAKWRVRGVQNASIAHGAVSIVRNVLDGNFPAAHVDSGKEKEVEKEVGREAKLKEKTEDFGLGFFFETATGDQSLLEGKNTVIMQEGNLVSCPEKPPEKMAREEQSQNFRLFCVRKWKM